MSTSFTHSPLNPHIENSIRLIEILPSSLGKDTIECKLTHATTESKYFCLSYVWGSIDDSRTITINGKPFIVRQNLWEFLKAANDLAIESHPIAVNVPRVPVACLWIDALCINQDNVYEKNQQVQRMGEIYEKAQFVVSWLGKNFEVSLFLKSLRTEIDRTTTFCRNAYWQRAWVTQEVTKAQNIVFLAGRESADLSVLIPPVREYTERFDRNSFPALFDILDRKEQCTLLENLWRFRDKQCFDQRDRIYSLLSISQVDAGIIVDYSQSIAKLAITVLWSLKNDFCLCTAKMVLQTLGVEGSSFANELPTMVELRFSPPSWDEFPGKCPCCTESISLNYVFNNILRSRERYVYCLSCFHDSRIRYQILDEPHHHGHLIVAARSSFSLRGKAQKSWRVHWKAPFRDENSTTLKDVNVLSVANDGSAVLQMPMSVLAQLAAVRLSAEFYPHRTPEIIETLVKNSMNGKENPEWRIVRLRLEDVQSATTL
jgi:hypothetical protein